LADFRMTNDEYEGRKHSSFSISSCPSCRRGLVAFLAILAG